MTYRMGMKQFKHMHNMYMMYTLNILNSALAVYSRSPAAFDALKSLNILQLPTRSSLQAFLSCHQNEPGVKEESLALQFKLYSQHKAEKSPTPTGDGMLILMKSEYRER